MHRIVSLDVQEGYKIQISFDDGVSGVVDLSGLVGKGVFSAWSDYARFEKVAVGEAGELIWPDEVDLCPDSLYLQITGKKPDDVFPALKHEAAHA